MALSNIGNEPRRELTESAVGIIAGGGWLFVAYLIAKHIDPYYVSQYTPPWWVTVSLVTAAVSFLGPILFFGMLYFTHLIGEEVCDWLKALRIDPRPSQRYGRNGR